VRGVAAAVVVLVVLGACREAVTAPGLCPEYCPSQGVEMVDSVFVGVVVGDSTFSGYVGARDASGLQLVAAPGSPGITTSRAVVQFTEFPERLLLSSTDTATGEVVAVDSFRLILSIPQRTSNVDSLVLVLHRLPADVDSIATFTDLDPFFADSTRIGSIIVPDSVLVGTVETALQVAAFPTFEEDQRSAVIGVVLESSSDAFVTIGSADGGVGAQLTRFAQVESGSGTQQLADTRIPSFDTFVAAAGPGPPGGVHRVGGVPAARALMRLALPPFIGDSTEVIRATLVLVPSEAVQGVPGDSIRILAHRVTADVGAKSPIENVPEDSVSILSTVVAVGSTDTVRVDLTRIFQRWSLEEDSPRAIMLRAVPEGSGFAELRFLTTAGAAGQPVLHLTFIPPLDFGGR
jgi:hypothetical protein